MATCPTCGQEYSPTQNQKILSHAMAEYVNPKTGKVDGVYNSNDVKIIVEVKDKETKQVVERRELVRKDLFKPAAQAPAPPPANP